MAITAAEIAAAPGALERARRSPRRIGTRQMMSSRWFGGDGGAVRRRRCHRRKAPLTFQATARKVDVVGEMKMEGHEQPRIVHRCRRFLCMTLISPPQTPVDEEADG